MAYRAPLLRKLFEKDPNLPSFPDHTRRLLELLKIEDTPLADIAREVEKDPVLALRLVRLANSPAYGLRRDVNSLERALTVVGIGQISAVVASFASVDSCERFLRDPRFVWKDFWAHCCGTAFIAKALAERLGLFLRGAEFLAGLLHDLGYLALAKVDPALFSDAVTEAADHKGFLARGLNTRFGLTVEAAGEILADVSHLAPETIEVVRHLHDPSRAPEPDRVLVSVVSLGNELAHLAGLTFFRGTAEVEVVISELPAWKELSARKPEIGSWDIARLVFELERENAASEAFVNVSHSK